MNKLAYAFCSIIVMSCCCKGYSTENATYDSAGPKKNIDYIDPTIGNVGHLLEPTRPTAQLPHQMIRMYPLRKDYLDDQITAFPLTVVSHRLGEVFGIKPVTSPISDESWKQRLTYDHDLEITRPWYYSAYLVDDDTKVEFVPGRKCGIFRFSFSNATSPSLLLYALNDGPSSFISHSNEVSGVETWHGDTKVYLYAQFDSDARPEAVADNKVIISFAAKKMQCRYAISFVSKEQARKNYIDEFGLQSSITFESFRTAAENAWKHTVSQITVEGGTDGQKRSFFSALYRTNERMVDISEDNRYYSGFDGQVHRDSIPFYTDDWVWDTYLALHPLNTILHPAMEQNMLRSYLRMYEQGNWMPSFPVLFGDNPCMNAHHASVLFIDAYRKGLTGVDYNKAYEGIRRNTEEGTLLPWRRGGKTSLDNFYAGHGFFPALRIGEKETVADVHPFEKRQAVAVTLGASYDDWAVGQLAKELGKQVDYEKYNTRSLNFRNLWDSSECLFMPRDSAGNWIHINPKLDGGPGARDFFDENNGWTYLWQVQRDIPSLIQLMGGKISFEKKLDQLFREDLGTSKNAFWNNFPDATGLTGEFSMGNEPSMHIPYLYNFTNAPWKTQKRVRYLLNLWFTDNVFGMPGDEDGGGMSAFMVFSSMGFYPLAPGLPVYTIGSPLFSRVTINLDNGKKFRIIAHHCNVVNKYIQSARLNGKPLDVPWFTHDELMNGATLELQMGPLPNKRWGTGSYAYNAAAR